MADSALAEYRKHIQDSAHKSQEEFDKTVLSLSGGALGISFVFLKDVIGTNPIADSHLLFISWIAWGSSATAVLASYYMSHMALRRTLRQINDGTVRTQRPGGALSTLVAILNASGALLFFAGVLSITLFANANFMPKGVLNGSAKVAARAASTAASTVSAAATTASAPATRHK